MPTDARLSLALIALAVVVTLGAKAALTDYAASDDLDRLDRDIVALLARDGFAVVRRDEPSRPPTFYAQRGPCRVVIRHATAPGSFDRRYRQNAAATGVLRYRIGTAEYRDPPLLRMWFADIAHATLARLGAGGPVAAPIAIAWSPQCRRAVPVTTNLRTYPRR